MNDGELEINVGNPEKIQQINKEINYDPDTTDINEVTEGNRVTISGDLVYVGEPNKFNRDDGSEGVVQNIEIADDTGQIRAALWGNNILGPDPNTDSVTLLNAEIKRGYEDNLEANVGYNATVVLSNKINSSDNSNRQEGEEDTTKTGDEQRDKKDNQPENAVKTDTPPGLEKKSPSVEEDIEETEDEQIDQESTQEAEEDKKSNQTRSSEFELSVTGVVLETGDEITLDTTEERLTVIPPNDVDVSLGQEVTVRGKKVDKGIKADEIF
jgi:replication factor A1